MLWLLLALAAVGLAAVGLAAVGLAASHKCPTIYLNQQDIAVDDCSTVRLNCVRENKGCIYRFCVFGGESFLLHCLFCTQNMISISCVLLSLG